MATITRKQRERLQRQTDILDTAEVLFQNVGYEKTTIEDIAHQTELAKGTIYLYFSSKEEIVVGLLDRGLQELVSAFISISQSAGSGLSAYQQMGSAFIDFFHKHPNYPKIFALYHSIHVAHADMKTSNQSERAITLHKTKLVAVMAKAIQRGTVDGSIRSDVDPEKTAILTALTAASFVLPQGTLAHTHPENCQTDASEYLKYLFSLLSRAIQA